MLININNPIYNTLIVFTIIILLIYIKKPNIIYDKKKKEYRQFGTKDGKTILPIYIVGILVAVILYIFFNHISQNINSKKNIINTDINNQIHNIQNQIHQLLQHQLIQQQLNNNISLPNKFNI